VRMPSLHQDFEPTIFNDACRPDGFSSPAHDLNPTPLGYISTMDQDMLVFLPNLEKPAITGKGLIGVRQLRPRPRPSIYPTPVPCGSSKPLIITNLCGCSHFSAYSDSPQSIPDLKRKLNTFHL
jgi:hypothetical protein